MKDKRVIKIKDPRLCKIRNEFRKLWSAAESIEWRHFRAEMEKLCVDERGNFLDVDQMKERGVLKVYHSFQQKQQDLREDFKRSICMCYTCGRADSDMYYNKPYDSWFCVECVKFFKVMHPKMKQKYVNKDPVYYDFDEDFGASFF